MFNQLIHYYIHITILVFHFIGHAHITDFNIAATLHGKKLASSLSGTKPYIGMYKTFIYYYFVVLNVN